MPRKKQIDNSNKPIEDVAWFEDWGVMVAHCPSCGELAYGEKECVFCHQKYRYIDKPKGYEDTVITMGEWEITQVYGSWGVYITCKGKLITHISCSKQLSKKRLKEWLESYVKMGK